MQVTHLEVEADDCSVGKRHRLMPMVTVTTTCQLLELLHRERWLGKAERQGGETRRRDKAERQNKRKTRERRRVKWY